MALKYGGGFHLDPVGDIAGFFHLDHTADEFAEPATIFIGDIAAEGGGEPLQLRIAGRSCIIAQRIAGDGGHIGVAVKDHLEIAQHPRLVLARGDHRIDISNQQIDQLPGLIERHRRRGQGSQDNPAGQCGLANKGAPGHRKGRYHGGSSAVIQHRGRYNHRPLLRPVRSGGFAGKLNVLGHNCRHCHTKLNPTYRQTPPGR